MERFRRRVSADENISRLERAISGLTVSRKSSPGRHASGDEDTSDESLKGSLGLNLLRDVTEPLIEFIFVHGLGGGSRKTWSKSSSQYHYWPKEWLSQDPEFACVRIWSFGYKADWNERRDNILEVHDFALALLGEVRNAPDIRRGQTRIVFVAHSMGGLVVKQAYILAREDPALNSLARRIHTLYFLATPHRGSDLIKTLVNILKISYGQKAFVSNLERNSSLINSTNDSFRHHAENLHLWSFYETLPCQIILTSAVVVDKASATLGYAREHISPLNADHRGVCKFNLPSDPNYKTLRNAFITTIDTILSQISQVVSETTKLHHDKLAELTGFSGPPTDDLAVLDDARTPGSCWWLISKPSYLSWRTPWSDSPPIFWLIGNAGSGKSVLGSQVVQNICAEKLRCSYFFFQHSNDVKSSIAGCLRALAYQMAISDEAILRKVLGMEQDTVPCVQWDERTTWRKLFLGCIFKISKPLPQYWVIDALDECRNLTTFVKLIKEVPWYIKVFLTSRSSLEAQQWLSSLGSFTEPCRIRSEDILDDLGTYIDSRMNHLPFSNESSQLKLKEILLNKSSGSFLWISLIMEELAQTYSEEDAEEILNEVPEDMNRLYSRMLRGLPTNERAIRLTQCLFFWTLLTRHPLTLSEMQHAIKLDLNQTIHDLGKSLPAICGQFMSVDQSNCIRSIHQTAHTFLLNQGIVPQLAVNERRSHSRIAQACLRSLNGIRLHGGSFPFAHGEVSEPASGSGLLGYACESFSDHVQMGIPEDTTTFDLLCTFLEGRVRAWIEYLATAAQMHHVVRTAKNLHAYSMRRVKALGPHSTGNLEAWAEDLVKVTAKFRAQLSRSPAAIHHLIPALCPLNSMMCKTFSPRNNGFLVDGLKREEWDDCIAMIDFQGQQLSAIAFVSRYLALATSQGPIHLYYHDSIQIKHTLAFGERAKALLLSNDCEYLAASGLRKVAIWDTGSGAQIWTFSLAHTALSVSFNTEMDTFVAATQGGYTSSWSLLKDGEPEQWTWSGSPHSSRVLPYVGRSPSKLALSPDANTLAACYRGLPIYLFDIRAGSCVGCCERKFGSEPQGKGNQYLVDSLVFNPNMEVNALVVSYGDGDLGVFDKTSHNLCQCIPNVFAQTLACSPDGSLLVTGSSRGSIRVFEFEKAKDEILTLVYRIDTPDNPSRSIAFGGNNLRFADIHGSRCRIWEPGILIKDDSEDSQSGISQQSTVVSESTDVGEQSPGAIIAAICHDSEGNHAFCGRMDGIVVQYKTQGASQGEILYRHALNIRITSIAFCERSSLLMTADESGRILIYRLSFRESMGKDAKLVSNISTEEAVQKLLPDPSGQGVLIISRKFAMLRALGGEHKGCRIALSDEHDGKTVSLHPTRAESFIVLGNNTFDVHSWADGVREEPLIHPNLGGLSVNIIPPTPLMSSFLGTSHTPQSSWGAHPLRSTEYIVNTTQSQTGTPALQIWSSQTFNGENKFPISEAWPDPDKVGSRVRQLIAVWDAKVVFVDTQAWVCTLELSSGQISARNVRQHFFLLSEWQNGIGNDLFTMVFSESTTEFLIAFRDRLLTIRNGLSLSESWKNP